MLKLLFKFWPVFLPLLLYTIKLLISKRKDKRAISRKEWRIWMLTLITTLVVLILTIVYFGASHQSNTQHTPPSYSGTLEQYQNE